jgi:Fur family ferric uptake transcriptional regulator
MATSSRDDTSDLRDELHAVGLRATASRIAVLRLLRRATSPVSHAEVTDQLQNDGFDRATLYRNLFDLNRVGLARRSDLGDHVWRFEAILQGDHPTEEHPHFVCNQCGQVECVDGVELLVQRGAKGPRAIRKKAVAIQLKGLCDRCNAA